MSSSLASERWSTCAVSCAQPSTASPGGRLARLMGLVQGLGPQQPAAQLKLQREEGRRKGSRP